MENTREGIIQFVFCALVIMCKQPIIVLNRLEEGVVREGSRALREAR